MPTTNRIRTKTRPGGGYVRQCCDCERWLPLTRDNFVSAGEGWSYYCKPCYYERRRSYRSFQKRRRSA